MSAASRVNGSKEELELTRREPGLKVLIEYNENDSNRRE